jgi:hypothetical protein
MQPLRANRELLVGLAQSMRVALVVPSLFAMALLVIKQPEIAGFAVLGTFAHLAMVEYEPAGRSRFIQSAMLTVFGSIMVTIGALASSNVWLAVCSTVAVGFLIEIPQPGLGAIANIRSALLLSFLAAVAAPVPTGSALHYVLGWTLAGAVAQPVLLLIWVSAEKPLDDRARRPNGAGARAPALDSIAFRRAIHSGFALGVAVLVSRLFDLKHAFWVVLGVIPLLKTNPVAAARTFWREQAGTLIGFLASAVLVSILGSQLVLFWLLLPFVVFGAACSARFSLIAGQAMFTVFAVMLFCILLPQQSPAGLVRLEDIAIGAGISMIVGLALRPLNGEAMNRLRASLGLSRMPALHGQQLDHSPTGGEAKHEVRRTTAYKK